MERLLSLETLKHARSLATDPKAIEELDRNIAYEEKHLILDQFSEEFYSYLDNFEIENATIMLDKIRDSVGHHPTISQWETWIGNSKALLQSAIEDSWQPIDTAPLDTPILIRYIKNGKGYKTKVSGVPVVTQAIAKRIYTYTHKFLNYSYNSTFLNDELTKGDFDCKESDFLHWEDYLGRLIADTSAKSNSNVLTHWRPLPEEPDEEDSIEQ